MDNLPGSPAHQQNVDDKKAAFKQPYERTKNTPKKEEFVSPLLKPFPEAATMPLPAEPEEDALTSENSFERRPKCELEDLEKEFSGEEDKAAEHSLYNQYEEKIQPYIDLVDSLRSLGIEKDLSLPVIVVIGDQSSGKSSVLEALSGVPLPRGSGIVTRCPLVLRLRRLPEGEPWQGKICYQNSALELQSAWEVDGAIRQAQDVVAGPKGVISRQSISLDVWSPDVPDLALIDLPGIARVAVGDQRKDIGNQIKKLLKRIIDCKKTIILVVIPCNVDIATTEALKMAQEVDPTGERIIGVLTKPDLVDKGTEESIVNIVQNKVIPLKKGYMIVKCREQQDIHNNVTLAAAIQQERKFFESHKHFRVIMEEGKATVPCLAEKLTNELVRHITKTLPALESQIRETLHKTLQDLQRYGRGTSRTESEKLFFLTDLIKFFNQDISRAMRGEEQVSGDEVRLFTKIRKEFRTWGVILLDRAAKTKKTVPSKVCKYEDQYRGREFPGFNNYRTFEAIVQEQVRELEEPAMEILYNVMALVEEKFLELVKRNFANFHNLSRAAKVRIEEIREKQAAEAERHIRMQFKMERIVYCQDDLYIEDGASKRLSNQIPLIILSSVLHDFGENLQTSMLQLLQEKEKLNFLLEEDTEAAKRRNYLSERVDRLTKACQHLREFSSL